MQCGAINGADASACCCCDARLSRKTPEDIFVRASLPTRLGDADTPPVSAAISAQAAIDSIGSPASGAFSERPAAAPPPAIASLAPALPPEAAPEDAAPEDADRMETDSHEDRDPRPPWRREVAYRLDIYKARRQLLCHGDGRQSALPPGNSAGRAQPLPQSRRRKCFGPCKRARRRGENLHPRRVQGHAQRHAHGQKFRVRGRHQKHPSSRQ